MKLEVKQIEERARAFAEQACVYNEKSKGIAETAYFCGASVQHKIDVDKACEWIDSLMVAAGYDAIDRKKNLMDFCKAMEEQS